ncbi:hypothetical protein TGPRC2_297845 [Toxoplasma gondii TgCatPRC2]|uniref:Uncharacterized protein n=1 Tax=Toxoplasma gondii TgCatPRC2 TaxID=1130821 RepID=A0A151H1U8_TOXGO|nr:hypothetical protein TGPRC2_297845 [Toxoplasma gondii TgCatPRC2]
MRKFSFLPLTVERLLPSKASLSRHRTAKLLPIAQPVSADVRAPCLAAEANPRQQFVFHHLQSCGKEMSSSAFPGTRAVWGFDCVAPRTQGHGTTVECKFLRNSRRYKVDAVFKGKRSMFPSSGPIQDYGVSHFDKQKRRTADWLETERRRIAALPEPLRPLEFARTLNMYKEKLIELYGDEYVRREWATLVKLTRAKLMGTE